jgi:hypothetical protein
MGTVPKIMLKRAKYLDYYDFFNTFALEVRAFCYKQREACLS